MHAAVVEEVEGGERKEGREREKKAKQRRAREEGFVELQKCRCILSSAFACGMWQVEEGIERKQLVAAAKRVWQRVKRPAREYCRCG